MSTPPLNQHLSIYDGRDQIGAVIQRAGRVDAFTPAGVHLGNFANLKAAVAAINASLSCSCVGDTSARRDGSP